MFTLGFFQAVLAHYFWCSVQSVSINFTLIDSATCTMYTLFILAKRLLVAVCGQTTNHNSRSVRALLHTRHWSAGGQLGSSHGWHATGRAAHSLEGSGALGRVCQLKRPSRMRPPSGVAGKSEGRVKRAQQKGIDTNPMGR